MSGLNNILAQSVNPLIAPLPLLALQCNTISANQVIESVQTGSGASPVSVSAPIADIVFTGIADTAPGASAALQWTNPAITSSSVIRCTLIRQVVNNSACFAVFKIAPGTGSAIATVINVGTATSGASKSCVLLFEIIA